MYISKGNHLNDKLFLMGMVGYYRNWKKMEFRFNDSGISQLYNEGWEHAKSLGDDPRQEIKLEDFVT